MGKKGESNCQSQPLGNASLPLFVLEMETEERFTVVHILALTTFTVSRSSLLDL